jgi:hypothetical protein
MKPLAGMVFSSWAAVIAPDAMGYSFRRRPVTLPTI